MPNLLIFFLAVNNDIVNKGYNWSGTMSTIGRLLYYLIVSGIVIFFAYYCTKLIASSRFNKGNKLNSNIKILESISVGIQGSIQLVKIGEKYILIAVTKEKISFLTEVNEDQLNIVEKDETQIVVPFEKYMQKFIHKNKSND